MNYLIILIALLPVAILALYIYIKDKKQPEPIGLLLKGFGFGVLSVLLSLCISIPFGLMGLYTDVLVTISDSIRYSFFAAAIPEEAAKLFMLWLLLRKNKYFDEKMDGIVYAVCVSLGFAALENVMYLFDNYDNWMSVGIGRALFAVPGHFGFGILMGYYYSLAKFYPKDRKINHLLVFAAPVIAHGIYDSILFSANITPEISGLLMIVVIAFCVLLWKQGSKRIAEHLKRDSEDKIVVEEDITNVDSQ